MPELPEVETVRRGLSQEVVGARIRNVTLNRGDLRFPFPPRFAERLMGARIESVERRAKYLLLHLDTEDIWLVHLGMSGRFLVRKAKTYPPQKHDHVLITLSNGKEMVFNDARRFGIMDIMERAEIAAHPLLAHLGPEPLSEAFTAEYLESELLRRSGPVKPALMDQELVVGVGNIYASEVLFRAGLHPAAVAKDCAIHAPKLVPEIRAVLEEAIHSGGSTLRNYARESGETGYFQHHFRVYGRDGKPCMSCGTEILRLVQAGRASFFCPSCQPTSRKHMKKKNKK